MKLLCFDLDNTLIKSEKAHFFAFDKALREMKEKKVSYSFLVKLLGKPKEEIAKEILNTKNKKKIKMLLCLHDKYLRKKYFKLARKIPGIEKALKILKRKYDLAVLSNCTHRNIKALLKGANLNPRFFKFIIGMDEVSCSKPCPEEIRRAWHLEKHKPEFMIGDSIYDIMAAKKAKVKAIAVLTGHYSRKKLSKLKPYAILKSVSELPKFLEN